MDINNVSRVGHHGDKAVNDLYFIGQTQNMVLTIWFYTKASSQVGAVGSVNGLINKQKQSTDLE